jgi:hypothetical protein
MFLKKKKTIFFKLFKQKQNCIYRYSACGRTRSSNEMNNVNIDRILNVNDDGLLKKSISKKKQKREGRKPYKVTSVSHN